MPLNTEQLKYPPGHELPALEMAALVEDLLARGLTDMAAKVEVMMSELIHRRNPAL